jgi:hypothetical protein
MFVHIEYNQEGGYQIGQLVTSCFDAWLLGFDDFTLPTELMMETYHV